MKYVISLIFSLIGGAIIGGISALLRKPKDDESNIVVLPKLLLVIGLIFSAVFLIIALIVLFSDEIFLSLFFVLFSLIGVFLIIGYINCRIVFNKDDFTYKTFFGIKRTIQYKDLTSISGNKRDVKLYAGKRIIRIDESASNKDKFISYAKLQYKKYNNGNSIPKSIKKDIFNNHVENPEEFILVFSILAIVFLSFTIFIISYSIPIGEKEFEDKTVVIEKYEVSEEDLVLFDTAGNKYIIYQYNSIISNEKSFIDELDNNAEIKLSVRYNEKSDSPFYLVSEIESKDSEKYLSYDVWRKNQVKSSIKVLGIIFSIYLVMFAMISLHIYVGRNPNKFSDKVLHMFFKPGVIKRD